MKTELRNLLKRRGVELLGEDEIGPLRELEARWRAMQAREAEVMPLRVSVHQEAAHAAFMADPSIENEMQVAILADTPLTLRRYAARRAVISEYMKLLASKAGELLRPLCERVSLALQEELELRKTQKTTLYAESDPRVKECRGWMDLTERAAMHVLRACGRQSERSPIELAEIFLPDAPGAESGE